MHEVITNNLDLWTSALLTKSSAGRGSNGKQEAYGIKKLRELILELAVRGKLVPQDSADEPARELLKRVATDKALMAKGGTIRREKEFPAIADDEIPFGLPDGWEWVRFGTVAQHNSGKTLDSGRNSGQLREYITTSNLYWGRFDLLNIRQMPIGDDELEKCTARQGDLLICEGGEAGRAAVWPYGHDVCFQNHIHRARFFGGIDAYFFYRFFEKLNATGEIDQHRKGVGISNMSSKALASIVAPLPPLTEQHRIVAKVDELLALCDQLEQQQTNSIEAHQALVKILLGTLTNFASQEELDEAWTRIANHFDTLFVTESSIDQLKQTILQLAVMGKLVPQHPNDEPAGVLLQKITAEKGRMVKEGKIKKQNPLSEINDGETLFELPSGWAWTRLQDVIDVRDGTHDSPKDALGSDTYPLVTSRNFVDGEIDFDSARRISAADHFEIAKRSAVEKFDILFSMIGGNLGNQVMVRDERQFSVKNVALFKYYNKALTSPFFVKKYMEHLALDLQEKAIGGAQPFVSLGFLRNLVFALPPIEEQHRIVAKVDEFMALCEALRTRINEAQTTQIHLADTIVEWGVA